MKESHAGDSLNASEEQPLVLDDNFFTSAPLGTLFVAMQSDQPSEADRAWGECYRRYNQKVWSSVVYVLRTIPWLREPNEVAVDVTSEVFARLPHTLRHYREIGKAESWLVHVAVRTAMRQKESLTGAWSKTGTRRVSVEIDENIVSEHAMFMEGDEHDAQIELSRRLDAWALDPGKARWLEFVQFFLDGYNHDEIAEKMGITPATSRTWLWKIRRELGRATDAEVAR